MRKKKEEVHELNLKELISWLDSFSEKEDITSELVNIKKKIEEEKRSAEQNIEKLLSGKLMNPNTPERAKQIMEGNRKTYSEKVKRFISDIQLPEEHKDIPRYSDELEENLEEFGKSTTRNYQILQEFFKNESAALAQNLKRVSQLVKNAKDVVEGSAQQKTEHLKDKTEEINKAITRKESLHKEITSYENDIEETRKKIRELEKEKEDLESSDENKEYKKLLEDKEDIKKKLSHLEDGPFHHFSVLKTALKKYERVALDSKLIDRYIENPLGTLKKDDELKILDILARMKGSIREGSVQLKDKKKDKILGTIDTLDKEYLESFIKEFSETKKQLEETVSKIQSSEIDEKFKNIREFLERNRRELSEMESALEEIKEELEKIDIAHLKEKLEEDIDENLDEKVKIR